MSKEDYERFEAFINYFEDEQYERWIDGEDAVWKNETEVRGATDAQREKALSLRTPASIKDEENAELDQSYEESKQEPEVVYVTSKQERPVQYNAGQREEYMPVQPRQQPSTQISLDNAIKREQVRKQSISRRTRVSNSIKGFFNRFRRGKK